MEVRGGWRTYGEINLFLKQRIHGGGAIAKVELEAIDASGFERRRAGFITP
jgi:hypothetical protein